MLYRLPDVPGNPIVELVEDVSHHPRHSGLVRQVINTDLYAIEDQRSPLSPIPEKWEEGGSCLEFQPWHCWLLENGHAIYDWYAVKIVQDPQGQEVVEYKERPTPLAFIAKSPLVDQQREYIEPFFECDFSRIASVGNPMVRLPVSARASLAVSLRNRLAGCQKEANQELNKVIQRIDEEEDFDEDGVDLYRIQPPRLNQPVAVDPRTSTLKVGWISPKGNFYAVPNALPSAGAILASQNLTPKQYRQYAKMLNFVFCYSMPLNDKGDTQQILTMYPKLAMSYCK